MITITNPDVFKKQRFILISEFLEDKYVDLAFEPIIETLQVNQENGKKWIYDKDYTIIESGIGLMNRLTWDGLYCKDGDGLYNILEEYVIIEIQYIQKD